MSDPKLRPEVSRRIRRARRKEMMILLAAVVAAVGLGLAVRAGLIDPQAAPAPPSAHGAP